jgi:hypothetical protein
VIITDNSGNVNGTQQSVPLTGTGTAVGIPAPVSISPINGTGSTETFTLNYSESSGAATIEYVNVLFNPALTPGYGCYIQYAPPTNSFQLFNDAGTTLMTAVKVGSTTPTSNSQCTVNASGATISGNNLTLTFAITFASGFSGQKNVYLYGVAGSGNSGWVLEGTWTPSARQAMTVGPASPINGSGASQSFTLSLPDSNGESDEDADYVLFSTSSSTLANACWIGYFPASNLLDLRNNAGTAWSTGITPGSATQLSNSQCTLTASSVTLTPGGITLGLSLTFGGTFTAQQNVYMETIPYTGTATGFVLQGTWKP